MKRAVLLFVLMGTVLSSAFMLPDFVQTESAIRLEIPERLEDWSTHKIPESDKERAALAKDTKFSKAVCVREKPDDRRSFFQTDVPRQYAEISIVLSGYDLANSIHRPERCMPAQGHQIQSSSKLMVEVPSHGVVPVRRLLSTRDSAERGRENFVTYYFFVGHDRITEDHTRRTLFDISDRLFKGQAQKWAYVSTTTGYRDERSGNSDLPDVAGADAALTSMIATLAAGNIDWEQLGD